LVPPKEKTTRSDRNPRFDRIKEKTESREIGFYSFPRYRKAGKRKRKKTGKKRPRVPVRAV